MAGSSTNRLEPDSRRSSFEQLAGPRISTSSITSGLLRVRADRDHAADEEGGGRLDAGDMS